jgi:hypothetical protein
MVTKKTYTIVEHILCVKLVKDRIKLDISDFDFLRAHYHDKYWEKEYGNNADVYFSRFTKYLVKLYTVPINYRLSFYAIGSRKRNGKQPNTGVKNAFIVFEYLWRRGIRNLHGSIYFEWVSLRDLSKNLVRYRKWGAPKKVKGKYVYNYEDNEGNPIPHRNELIRILKKLVNVELIEIRKEIVNKHLKPDKQKENVFYRISSTSRNPNVTVEEKYKELSKRHERLLCDYDDVSLDMNYLWIILEELGIVPSDAIERSKEKERAKT